jgi:hypothetical protein
MPAQAEKDQHSGVRSSSHTDSSPFRYTGPREEHGPLEHTGLVSDLYRSLVERRTVRREASCSELHVVLDIGTLTDPQHVEPTAQAQLAQGDGGLDMRPQQSVPIADPRCPYQPAPKADLTPCEGVLDQVMPAEPPAPDGMVACGAGQRSRKKTSKHLDSSTPHRSI